MTTTTETSGLVRRHPVLFGFVLMFVCTWPIDLWAAAGSHGLVSVTIPPFLPILVGYGFVVAAVVMTAVLDGRAGVVALLRRFLIWRFGVVWYAVVLLGPVAVDLTGIGIDVLLHGTVPAFDEPFINRILGWRSRSRCSSSLTRWPTARRSGGGASRCPGSKPATARSCRAS